MSPKRRTKGQRIDDIRTALSAEEWRADKARMIAAACLIEGIGVADLLREGFGFASDLPNVTYGEQGER